VYRTYTSSKGEVRDPDRRTIHEACRAARDANPKIDARLFEFIERLLLIEFDGDSELEFVLRFQQLTGPAMAKGVEDTVFYRYARLVALNEVGADPSEFSIPPGTFHERMRHRQAHFPEALNTTSTHDTKRSEDVRARLLSLSEIVDRWQAAVRQWRERLAPHTTPNATPSGGPAPDPQTEYFLLQNLVGAWPLDRDRMGEYMTKAVREAKQHSSWQAPNEAYESAIARYLDRLYGDEKSCASIASFVDSLELGARANSLNQLMLKLLCPGVPDIYQGTELWDFSLVDPDNRRPVDFSHRAELLQSLENAQVSELWQHRADGRVKLWCLQQGMALRSRRAESVGPEGDYVPLGAEGTRADRVIAFCRGHDVIAVITRWWLRFGEDFEDTILQLPEGTWRNPLTGRHDLKDRVPIRELIAPLPVGVLERQP
jgi:(1->4)-alpha-D-glucan 1-alpha-D-glucosylmutase